MARVGSFAGPSFDFGAPLSVIAPPDNVFPRFDPDIAAEPGLSEAEMRELQDQVNELHAASLLARDRPFGF